MNKSDFYIYLIVTVISILLGYLVIKYCFIDNVAPFTSDVDGQNYTIRKTGNIETRQTAANYLASLNERICKLVDYMYANKLPDVDTANRLYHRWSKCKLKETNSSETSAAYTLNKSSEIRICIRNKNGNFENINTSMFVILHEISHCASISFGHNEEFKNNFSYITHLASKLGLYKPEDFVNDPKTYCGTVINTTPCQNGSCEFNNIKS